MANFTVHIKRELLSQKLNTREEQVSSLSAFMRTSGCISFSQSGLGFFLVTELEKIAEKYLTLFERLYGVTCQVNATEDRLRGKDKLTLSYSGEAAWDILVDLGVVAKEDGGENYGLALGIPVNIVESEKQALAYIKGAFLGGGSCTLPREGAKTGYHIEFVFTKEEIAGDFVELLERFGVFAKVVKRKESLVVYFASFSAISDFLLHIGAENSLEMLSKTVEARERMNNSNRVNNCFVGNMDRTATAAAKQCIAIEFLKGEGVLPLLDEELRLVAEARLQNREASLVELAKGLNLSKSCITHRLRKIMSICDEIKEEKQRKEASDD